MDFTNNSENVRQTPRSEAERDDFGNVRGQAQPLNTVAMGSLQQSLSKNRSRSWDDLHAKTSPHVPTAHHHAWLVEQCDVLKECRAAKTANDRHLEIANTKWQQLRAQYRKSRNQYEASIDPFRPTSTSSVTALRESLAYHQQTLEAHSTQVRALRQKQEAADQALDNCLLVLSEPTLAQSLQTVLQPILFTNVHQDSEQPVRAKSQSTSHQDNRTPPRSKQPPTDAPPPDETMVHVQAEVKLADGQESIPHSSKDTAKLSPLQAALLEKYFRIAANVQNLGERLADHNYEYWDAVAIREHKEDQDEVLSISEEEFEKGHHEERTTITQQLDDAIKEADRLYDDCMKQGIDVEANRMARRDDPNAGINDAEYQQIFQNSLDLIPVEAFKNAEIVRGGTPDSDSETGDLSKVKDAVTSWVDNISGDTDTLV